MGWEEELFALLDDLEGQASAAWEAEREVELLDRAQAEYAAVTLASRLMASLGSPVTLDLPHVGRVHGVLGRVGEDWCLLGDGVQDWIVPTRHVCLVHSASARSVPEIAWSPVHRLGLRSALRRLADVEQACVVHLGDGTRHEVVVRRVGADFVEASAMAGGAAVLVPYAAIVAVQSREA